MIQQQDREQQQQDEWEHQQIRDNKMDRARFFAGQTQLLRMLLKYTYDYDVESRTHDGLVLAQINSYIVNKAKHTPKDQMLNGRRIGDGDILQQEDDE